MLIKCKVDLLITVAILAVIAYLIATVAYAILAGELIIMQISLLSLCLAYCAYVFYAMHDGWRIRHKSEVFDYDCLNTTITLKTSPYFLGNVPICVFAEEKLLATTWRGTTIEFKTPADAETLTFKNRAEDVMAAVQIPDGKNMRLYIRPINVLPIKWEVTELDEGMAVDESPEYGDYEKLRLEFRSMDSSTLFNGSIVTIGILISIIIKIILF